MAKLLIVLIFLFSQTHSAPSSNKINNLTDNNSILKHRATKEMKGFPTSRPPSIVLFTQGECDEVVRSPRFYTENFVLENDGKSQVYAVMKIQVSGSPNITCIEIVSRSNDKTRPYIDKGGVGNTFVDVGVTTEYAKGFDFSVNLYGSFFSDKKK